MHKEVAHTGVSKGRPRKVVDFYGRRGLSPVNLVGSSATEHPTCMCLRYLRSIRVLILVAKRALAAPSTCSCDVPPTLANLVPRVGTSEYL